MYFSQTITSRLLHRSVKKLTIEKATPYGRIKETTQGISTYTAIWKRDIRIKGKGLTQREIAERLWFRKSQIKAFLHRYNRKQRNIAQVIVIKPKCIPRKDGTELPPSIQQLSKFSQMQYEIARKNGYIKRLEMEN